MQTHHFYANQHQHKAGKQQLKRPPQQQKGKATKTSTTFQCQQDSVAAARDVWLNELAGAEIQDARREVPAVKCTVLIEHHCSHPRL